MQHAPGQADIPATALLDEIADRFGRLLDDVAINPAAATAPVHLDQSPPCVLGDRPVGADVEGRLQLDAISDQDEGTMETEQGHPQPVLQMEPAQVVARSQ